MTTAGQDKKRKKVGSGLRNPFTLDSKEPTGDYQEFILGETRYSSLKKTQPEAAEKLFKENEEESKERYEGYKKLASQQE